LASDKAEKKTARLGITHLYVFGLHTCMQRGDNKWAENGRIEPRR
jgi:hypothetical protein